MTAQPFAGAGVPHGWRFCAALSAGLLWLGSLGLLLALPALVRQAHLYRERTGEGMMFAGVALCLVAAMLLLGLAHGLSVVGHGNAKQAPTVVLWARRLTWLLLALACVTAVLLPDALHGHCFRTCAPFPS